MKILLTHPHDIFSSMEPWTIRIEALAEELESRGHEVNLLYFSLDGLDLSQKSIKGINIIPLSRELSLKNLLSNIRKITALAKQNDILYLQKCFHYAALPMLIASFIQQKWLHYDWDDDETAIFFKGGKPSSYIAGNILRIFEKLLPRFADSVSYSSEKIKKQTGKQNNLIYFPVGADLPPADEKNSAMIKNRYNLNTTTFIYSGQLHGGQYVEDLLKAAVIMKKKDFTFKLLILGEGHDRSRLEKISFDNALTENVIFTGAVARERISDYLKASDIAVACFRDNEITRGKSPLKIAEYLSAGKAIVASNVGEVPRMLKDAGILIPPDSPEIMADYLINLASDPEKIRELEKKALIQAQNLSWQKSMEQLILFLEDKANQNIS